MWLMPSTILLLASIQVVYVNGMPKPKFGAFKTVPKKLGLSDAANSIPPWLHDITTSTQDIVQDVDNAVDDVTDRVTTLAEELVDLADDFLDSLTGPSQRQLESILHKLGSRSHKLLKNWGSKLKSGSPPKVLIKIIGLVKRYFQNYGYISKTKGNKMLEEIVTLDKKAMEQPIRNFQRLSGLKVTGDLDQETLHYMSLSRCGVEDTLGASTLGKQGYTAQSHFVSKEKRKKKKKRRNKNKNSKNEPRSRVRRYNIQGDKWNKKILTYAIVNYTPDMRPKEVRSAIHRALKIWADTSQLKFKKTTSVANADLKISFGAKNHGDHYHFDGKALQLWADSSSLKFKRISSAAKADITVSFGARSHGDHYPFDGRGGTLAHAFFPTSGQAHFDEDEKFSHRGEGTNLYIVAAHEFGHSLGLAHSQVKDSLMAPFYQGYVPDFKLHSDDINAIQKIYGKNVDSTVERPEKPMIKPTTSRVTKPTMKPRPNEPDICTTDLDAAMAYIQGRQSFTYIFKGIYYYKIDDQGIAAGYPKKIGRKWKGLPGNLNAAVQSARTRYTYFFKGSKVFSYDGDTLRPGFPKSAESLNLPVSPTAAFVWGANGLIYIFKKKKYYLYDDYYGTVNEPKLIANVWKGVPDGIDAAVTWPRNGKTYFFKDNQYWRFNNYYRKVDVNYPQNLNERWMGCASGGTSARLRKQKQQRTDTSHTRSRSNRKNTARRPMLARLEERPGNSTINGEKIA